MGFQVEPIVFEIERQYRTVSVDQVGAIKPPLAADGLNATDVRKYHHLGRAGREHDKCDRKYREHHEDTQARIVFSAPCSPSALKGVFDPPDQVLNPAPIWNWQTLQCETHSRPSFTAVGFAERTDDRASGEISCVVLTGPRPR